MSFSSVFSLIILQLNMKYYSKLQVSVMKNLVGVAEGGRRSVPIVVKIICMQTLLCYFYYPIQVQHKYTLSSYIIYSTV